MEPQSETNGASLAWLEHALAVQVDSLTLQDWQPNAVEQRILQAYLKGFSTISQQVPQDSACPACAGAENTLHSTSCIGRRLITKSLAEVHEHLSQGAFTEAFTVLRQVELGLAILAHSTSTPLFPEDYLPLVFALNPPSPPQDDEAAQSIYGYRNELQALLHELEQETRELHLMFQQAYTESLAERQASSPVQARLEELKGLMVEVTADLYDTLCSLTAAKALLAADEPIR